MTILYYECFSGISGDMNLGAMIDLGIRREWLNNELDRLNLPGWELKVSTDQRHGINGTKAEVIQTRHEHVHRHLSDIEKIINDSSLQPEVKNMAIKIFTVIAHAEAHVHNMPVDHVHFHEVGAIDAIIDIVGAAICFNKLRPDAVIISPVELGGGMVKCAHGMLPVPAPATAEIIKNLRVKYNGVDFEATTPTGAAILSVLSEKSIVSQPVLKLKKTGYGIGHRQHPEVPNILRVSLAETEEQSAGGHEAVLIECNIDDMNPEFYEFISERLFAAGASDVFLTNIIMKKGRPGTILSVICEKDKEAAIRNIIFTETTTIGLRSSLFVKHTMARETLKINTEFGILSFKILYINNEIVSAKPEARDCVEIALRLGIPLRKVNSILAGYAANIINKADKK